jgi:hypothetical protein
LSVLLRWKLWTFHSVVNFNDYINVSTWVIPYNFLTFVISRLQIVAPLSLFCITVPRTLLLPHIPSNSVAWQRITGHNFVSPSFPLWFPALREIFADQSSSSIPHDTRYYCSHYCIIPIWEPLIRKVWLILRQKYLQGWGMIIWLCRASWYHQKPTVFFFQNVNVNVKLYQCIYN